MGTSKLRIFMTGGHVTTALAVIEEIKRQKRNWEIIFIGRKYALEGSSDVSEEYRLITREGIQFVSLTAGRFLRSLNFFGFLSILKIPLGIVQALWFTTRFKPKLIVSFGGYMALPVAVSGWLLRIPVITHEQTRTIGLTNLLIGRICRKVLVSHEQLLARFPKGKAILTGLPLRQALFSPPREPLFPYVGLPLIYITGGTTGAKSLNELLFPLISGLAQKYMVVHQTGYPSFPKAERLLASLPMALRGHYYAAPYFEIADVSWIYHKSILVIGRSGANTVGELAALGKVALLVPLPWSAGGEQQLNAMSLVEVGSAMMVDQRKVNSVKLGKIITGLLRKRKDYELRARVLVKEIPRGNAAKVLNEVDKLVSK